MKEVADTKGETIEPHPKNIMKKFDEVVVFYHAKFIN
jgi:hypothetical protein